MPTEIALLESRALRADHLGRVDVLDKVKALALLPDGIHLRTQDVARYFEVSTEAIKKVANGTVRSSPQTDCASCRALTWKNSRGTTCPPFPCTA